MPRITSPLPATDQKVAAHALQGALVDLLDLSLLGKQAHWNVVGRNFRSLHLQLDEVVAMARLHSDTVAERAAAIGVNPDGSASTIAAETPLKPLAPEWVDDATVVAHFIESLETVIGRFRERVEATAEADPVSQDLLIGISADLEKTSWMFQAERA
jgi:starvation-inducible DNA-binding protein